MSLRDHLQEVYEERGVMTPATLVTAARPKSSPLHDRFEWDDKIAGQQYRLVQAGELIRSVKIVYREATDAEEAGMVRAWQPIRSGDGFIYKPTEEVVADELLSAMVLRDMEREWKQLHRRFGRFEEFRAMVAGDLGEPAA